jgi:hypothetical protein
MAKTKERSSKEIPTTGLNLNFSKSPRVFDFFQSDAFVQGLMGPVGCVAPETQVITEFGPMPIWQINRPMRVLSWNDQTNQFQLSWCGGSFPKGTDYLLRVTTQQGEFAASERHLLFCAGHDYQLLGTLKSGDVVCAASRDPLEILAFVSRQSSSQDGLRLTETAVDSLGRYAKSARLYGQRLLLEEGIDLAYAPLQDDAQESFLLGGQHARTHKDDSWGLIHKRIRQALFAAQKQIYDFFARFLLPCLALANQGAAGVLKHNGETTQQLGRFEQMTLPGWKAQLFSRCFGSFVSSSLSDRNIVSVERERVKRSYWDMQVLDTHNYVTVDGTIHHNSGKSYACAAKIMKKAVEQKPSPIDGIRYTRFAVVRNSYPMLKTTTIKTWLDLFPENTFGPMLWTPPITHHIRLPSRGDAAGIDCEVIFLALDQPKDVRKLLSLELTGAWVNEARELPKAVIDGLTHRVGRYPTKRDGGATWHGIWMDTNPMDDDHWWFRMAEKEKMTGSYAWKFYKQPGGIVEVSPELLPDNPEANDHIFASGRWWRVNPKAENIDNLPPGYYQQMLLGKNLDWIKCYAEGQYTYVQEGKPVWSEYDDNMMVDDIEYDPSQPLQVGLDFGLTPAAVIGQRLSNGRWVILHEIVTFDMGLERFGQQLLAELNARFPKAQIMLWGDPAGMQRDAIYEVTAFDHLRTLGLRAQPTHSNDFRVRREAAAAPMQRLIAGKPGLVVDRQCKLLRKSLAGGYHFKRISVGAGQERFRDVPNKNEHSHVGDAFGYLLLGGGEHKRMTRSPLQANSLVAQTVVNADFDVFGAR